MECEEFKLNEGVNAKKTFGDAQVLFIRVEANAILDDSALDQYELYDPNDEENVKLLEEMAELVK